MFLNKVSRILVLLHTLLTQVASPLTDDCNIAVKLHLSLLLLSHTHLFETYWQVNYVIHESDRDPPPSMALSIQKGWRCKKS